ncbi:uncharacterized protein LOC119989396 isoform X2 [Tripterygium wilfordii]|uniref:uncharacterized protein LOC119989396 isoform X2 n=1 Tax=Tripterygium wilfordii TaxID=458696 RepID=UPI0018F7F366|nr:uncharacterized protein LOC119989396 isoform X2 [Tripterygium wilfordii]XP_038690819.1 uncharacterized protein LOC119989396 isoform X2 [Tripterygium wilfordii]XP_038690820.1 uncharacterized protein LOC119989396 isoform X2 [Tripterygium wilfordii]XP_038690821.1 uncharacterized protein LOC119989396 isoform X2 [Tripterygium wilfordii]
MGSLESFIQGKHYPWNMAGSDISTDARDYGVVVDEQKKRVQCNYCAKEVSSFNRLQSHLGGVRGDVKPCTQVPENIRKLFWNKVNERRASLVPASGSATKRTETTSWSHVEASRCIGRFIYETGVDFDVVNSPSFRRIISATFKDGQVEYNMPNLQELRGPILEDEFEDMKNHFKNISDSWADTGCSILVDDWVNEKGQHHVNFLVDSREGTLYHQSADISSLVGNNVALNLLLDQMIVAVGVGNVVQVIANSATFRTERFNLEFNRKHKSVFWAMSLSYCIGLMLEGILMIETVKETVEQAKFITKYIHGNPAVMILFKDFSDTDSLVVRSNIRFAMPFLTLENIFYHEQSLKRIFSSCEWTKSFRGSSDDGKRMTNLVGNKSSFWREAELVIKATIPLINVISSIDRPEKPSVAYIYNTIDEAKALIKKELEKKKYVYNEISVVIDKIWNEYLHIPLHAAGYYLNPCYYYAKDFFSDAEVTNGLTDCISKLVDNENTRDMISKQLQDYNQAKGGFIEGCAVHIRDNVPPVLWWSRYGRHCPELQRVAIRILGQTCDIGSRYHTNRSVTDKLLSTGNNPIEQQYFKKLAYVHYNLQLRNARSSTYQSRWDGGSEQIDDWIVYDAQDHMEQYDSE